MYFKELKILCMHARVFYICQLLWAGEFCQCVNLMGRNWGSELFSSFLVGEETLPAPSLRKEARTLLMWRTLTTHCTGFSLEQQVLKSLNNVLIPLRHTEIWRNMEWLEAPDTVESYWLPVPLPVVVLDGYADILAWQSAINYTDSHTREFSVVVLLCMFSYL